MAHHQIEAEELVERLAHRPRHLLYSMITIDNASLALPVFVQRTAQDNRPSSLGVLDRLPPELLYQVLDYLDLLSLVQIISLSVRGRNIVLSLASYQGLIKYALSAVAILRKTRLISIHTLSDLYATLKSERCATCQKYGAYLFLPTCKRCCWECLRLNPACRVIPRARARKAFALSPKQVHTLPLLHSIPGHYGIARKEVRRYKLVSVAAARDLALSIHGSAERIAELTTRGMHSLEMAREIRYLQTALISSTSKDPVMTPDQGNRGADDPYFGLASTHFPSLSGMLQGGTPENGSWCKGCEKTFKIYREGRLTAEVILSRVPAGCDAMCVLLGLERRAHSRLGLIEHSQHCYGAQYFLR